MKKIIALMILIIVSALSFGCEDESKADNNSSNAIITIGETEEDLGISPEEFRTSFNGHVNSFAQELEKEKLGVNFKNFENKTVATSAIPSGIPGCPEFNLLIASDIYLFI